MAKLAERIVWAVPALGNLAATFYGWKLHRRRYGGYIIKPCLKFLKETRGRRNG